MGPDTHNVTETVTHDVELKLCFADEATPRELVESTAVTLLDKIAQEVPDVAIGAIAEAIYDPPQVVLEFSIDVTHPAELHEKLATVMRVLEGGSPVSFEQATHTHPSNRELVPA